MAKKVGQKTEKKEKPKGRTNFNIAKAMYLDEEDNLVSAVNKDKLLIAVPKKVIGDNDEVLYTGFDIRQNKPLVKGHFADIATYMDYQAFIAREKAARLITLAEEREKKAERIRKFGDEATRKKAMKIARMREQLATLEAQLTEEGIDVEEI